MTALHAFLREVQDRPFQWGVWDCLIFTNEAWRRMHGAGWADDWLGRYIASGRPLTRSGLRREYGHENIEGALCERLVRSGRFPPRGALVIGSRRILKASRMGIGFGISVGTSAAFLSSAGLVYYPIESIDSAWVRNDAA